MPRYKMLSNNEEQSLPGTEGLAGKYNALGDGEEPSSGNERAVGSQHVSRPTKLRRPRSHNSSSLATEEESRQDTRELLSTSAPVAAEVSRLFDRAFRGMGRRSPDHPEASSRINRNSTSINEAIAELTKTRNDLRFSLVRKYGLERANTLFRKQVEKSPYLLINAEEDDEIAATIKKFLEAQPGSPTVKGRWDVGLGAQRLGVWQEMMQSSTTVLVLLSSALCTDEIISLTYPVVFLEGRQIVPLYLEEPEEIERQFPANLQPVSYASGTTLYDLTVEGIKGYIDNLHAKCYKKHYGKQIEALVHLLT